MKKQQQVTYQRATYKFVIDRRKKILRCYASGHFTKAEARAYIREFIRLCSTIEDIENYTLVIHAQEQDLLPPDVLPLLIEIEDIYMSYPFLERRYTRLLNIGAQEQVVGAGGLRFLDMFQAEPSTTNALDLENAEYDFIKTVKDIPSDEIIALKQAFGAIYDVITQTQKPH